MVRASFVVLCLLTLGAACGDDDDNRNTELSDAPDELAETDAPGPDGDAPNRAPTLTAPAAATVVVGGLYEGRALGADPDLPNDLLTFEVVDAPLSLSLDRDDGRIVWSPREADLGTHTIALAVNDRGGLTASASFTIAVVAPGQPPALAAIPDQIVILGDTLVLPIVATDPDLPDDALTTTLALSPATSRLDDGDFVWTPQGAELGAHDVIVSVTDRDGRSASDHFIVRVIPVNGPPVAHDDLFVTPRGVTTTLTPLGNDVDPDGDALAATIVSEPRYGTLTNNGDGTFGYRPGSPAELPIEPVIAYRFITHPETGQSCFAQGHAAVGDVDGDGRTEIIARCLFGSGASNAGAIVMLRANKATSVLDVVWSTPTWSNGDPDGLHDDIDNNNSQPVLADLDRDGKLEIILPSVFEGHTLVFDHTGHIRHGPSAGAPGLIQRDNSGFRTVADLDGDGALEILSVEPLPVPGGVAVSHLIVMDNTATRLWTRPLTGSVEVDESVPVVVADLDLDARPEVIVDNFAFDADGEQRWFLPGSASDVRTFVGVANLDDDAFGEAVVYNASRGIEVRRHDGSCMWRARPTPLNDSCAHVTTPAAGYPAGIVIADLGGDGTPEIVAASFYDVLALDRDGGVVWHRPNVKVEDNAIQINDMAAFDFNGDGALEIVIVGSPGNNSTTIHGGTLVLDGRDGTTIATLPGASLAHPGRYTMHTLVADVDDDGSAELFIADQVGVNFAGSPTGLFIYKSGNAPWMPTRAAWNQWSYAVTNATTAGDVTAAPEPNWLVPGLNNFRVNVPLADEQGGSDRFTYLASDAVFESNTATVVLDIRRPNAPPMFLGTPPLVVGLGDTYHAPIRATDTDLGDVVTVELAVGPEGMALGSDDALYWATTEDDLGEHQVVLTATDLEGGYDLLEYTLRVVEPQPVPDVVGLQQAAAATAITTANFVVGRVLRADHPSVPEGAVMEQTPAAGSLAVPGAAVALVVSTGPGPADRDADADTYTPNEGDCDDANPATYPDANDPEADGADQDCDGIDGSRPIASIIIEPESLGLLVGERKTLRAWGIFADGSAQDITAAVTWSSTGTAASIDPDGGVLATAAGNATVKASRGALDASIPVRVTAQVGDDDTPPVAIIASPTEGESVFGNVTITGTASDDNLVRYDLQLAPANTNDWTTIATGTALVEGGSLGALDGTTLVNGAYFLRLTVLDAGGQRSSDEITVVIDGQQKLGLFSVSFNDLTLPMGGLPIEITRIYDSRDRTAGDFGVGWDLAIKRVTVSCSAALGEGWFSGKGGLAFQLLPERAHTCSVGLPDGTVETFDFAPSPATSVLIPFTFVTATFSPRPGTFGRLTAIDNPNLIIADTQPGPVTLYDDVTFAPYAPTRFRYTTSDETVYEIGPEGLESVTDKNGNTMTVTADGIAHSSDAAVGFERDASGRITALTDPLGNTQRYTYSARGDLVSHSDALGNVTRFFYDRDHGLVRIEDPLGRPIVRNDYDARGRLVAVTDAAGRRTTHTFDDDARTMTTTYPDGSTRVFRYDERGNVIGNSAQVTIDGVATTTESVYAYDLAGNTTLEVDADGVRVERSFDGSDATSEVIDPDGLALTTTRTIEGGRLVSATDALGQVTTYEHDARGNAIVAVGPDGATTRLTYDAAGRVSGFENAGQVTVQTFDDRGQVTAIERRDPSGVALSRTEVTHDANGNVTSETVASPSGEARTTRWTYDAAGRMLTVTDATGGVTTHVYDAVGQRVATIDPLGARTEMDYDATGQLVEQRFPDGKRERFTYDHAGRETSSTDRDGVVTETTYDELGRVVLIERGGVVEERITLTPGGRVAATTDANGNTTHFEYDAAGRLVKEVMPEVVDGRTGQRVRPEIRYELDAGGRRVAITDPNGVVTRHDYDARGRMTKTTFVDGATIEEAHDESGRRISTTDETGAETRFRYDARDRLVAVIEPAPRAGVAAPETLTSYDAFGDLRARTDALGRTTSFAYDGVGRLVRKVLPDGRVATWERDLAGRVTRATDFDGTVVDYVHDALGRELSRSTPGGASESGTWHADGLRASATDARGTSQLSYEGGQLEAVVEPDGTEIGYAYDARGAVTELAVDGVATRYGYDALGRVTTVTRGAAVTRLSYDPVGRPVKVELPNGVVETTTWDARGRPVELTHTKGGEVLARFVATYSERGQRTSVTSIDGAVESYTYDALGRLVGAKRVGAGAFELAYVYDAVGNRLSETRDGVVTTFTYGVNHELLNRTSGGVTRSFRYDARGNRIAEEGAGDTVSYAWDAFNRLASVSGTGGSASFGYDVDGRRVLRESGGNATRYVVDRQSVTGYDQVIEERSANGDVQAAFTFGQGPLALERGGVTNYFGGDLLGSTRFVTDAGGAVSERFDYLPYGELAAGSATNAQPHLFAGERYEAAAQAYHLRARGYDPKNGVFLSRDPHPGVATRPFSLHPYQYADADPINKVDPSGLFTQVEVNFVQSLTAGLQYAWGFVRAAAARCAATQASAPLMLAVAVPDMLYFAWTARQTGAMRMVLPPIPMPGGGIFAVDLRYPRGSGTGGGRDMSVRVSLTYDKFQGSIGFVRTNRVSRILGNGAVTYPLKCGVTIARVGVGLRKPSHLSSSVLLELFFDIGTGASAYRESGTHTFSRDIEIP